MSTPIFSYDWYRSLLLHARNVSPIYTFSDHGDRNGILLRHDVDLDLELALRLAEIEQGLGIKTTYFIMACCEAYSPLSKSSRAALRSMVDMGHEIGLHFDPTFQKDDKERQHAVSLEAQIISEACGREVRSLSLHCPSLHGLFPLFDGFINAYDPKFFSEKTYISDSMRNFRGKDPFEWVNKGETQIVQFLIHPMHYSKSGYGYRTMLRNKVMHDAEKLDAYFRLNSAYVDEVGAVALSQELQWRS